MAVADLVATTFAGVVFGLSLAAPPGPMNAIIAEESALRGFAAGFRAGLGAMTADTCFLVLSLAGFVAAIESLPRVRAAMVVVGGLLMWYFAVDAALSTRETLVTDGEAASTEPGKGFRKAFVLALTNPYQIVFWLTVGVGLLAPGRVDILSHTPYVGAELAGSLVVQTGTPALLAGLFGGILVWIVGFPAMIVAAGRRTDALAPLVSGGSALVLAGFGTVFLWNGLSGLV